MIVAALAAIALSGPAGTQEFFRVTYAVDRSNPEQVQITGAVFNDSMQDVFDVSVTAEAVDARGKVVARGITHVSARIPGGGSSPFVCKVPQVAAAVRYRAAVSAYRAGASPGPLTLGPAMPGFEGQVAFVTGASSGIGAALARELARQGADVALVARRIDRLAALAAEIQTGGRRAIALPCDVTRDGDFEAAVARTREGLGPIDVVVANAGFGVLGRLDRLSLVDYRRQLETNVFGVLRTIYAGLPDLKRTRGRLVLIGSVNAYLALAGSSPTA